MIFIFYKKMSNQENYKYIYKLKKEQKLLIH